MYALWRFFFSSPSNSFLVTITYSQEAFFKCKSFSITGLQGWYSTFSNDFLAAKNKYLTHGLQVNRDESQGNSHARAFPWEETGQDICATPKVFPRGCSVDARHSWSPGLHRPGQPSYASGSTRLSGLDFEKQPSDRTPTQLAHFIN